MTGWTSASRQAASTASSAPNGAGKPENLGLYDNLSAWKYLGFFILGLLAWSERAARLCFWSLNLGLGWMVFVALLPLGVLQLFESVNHGYYEARELTFLTNPTNRFLEWLRLPGDAVFITFGVLPLLWLCWLGVRYRRPGRAGAALASTDTGALFTEPRPPEPEGSP